MSPRPFRFGVAAAVPPPGGTWADQARRIENLGYQSLEVPDTLQTLAVAPALAAAAAVTTQLRVAAFVYAVTNHHPQAIAHDTLTLEILTGGRYELGLGLGRPAAREEAEALGLHFGTPGERIARLRATIEAVRSRFAAAATAPGPLRPAAGVPPIAIAGSGSRMLRLAAEEADIVALALGPQTGEDELRAKTGELRGYAGDRFGELEIGLNLPVIGDTVSPYVERVQGFSAAQLHAIGAVCAVAGKPAEMAEVLRRRRDSTGVSFYQVDTIAAEAFAPVVELLAGT